VADPDRGFRRTIKQILRVNHAGEYGAIRIYNSQIMISRVLHPPVVGFLSETVSHEREHEAAFRDLMLARGTRPCGALPLWGLGGTLLGLFTGLLGADAMMICTEAVERTVHRHLNKQLAWLGDRDATLFDTIKSVRDEEMGHLDGAKSRRASNGVLANALDGFVAGVTAMLIWCSTYGALTRMKSGLRRDGSS